MNITHSTKVVTTTTHTAALSADELKTCALSAVKKNVGLSDDKIASSKVDIAADGAVTVEIIGVASEAAAPEAPTAPLPDTAADAAAAPAAPHLSFAR